LVIGNRLDDGDQAPGRAPRVGPTGGQTRRGEPGVESLAELTRQGWQPARGQLLAADLEQ